MKTVKIDLAGRERHLAFTVEAMFQVEEEFGGTDKLLEAVMDGGRAGYDAACRAAAMLAEQGELGRRALGYEAQPMAEAADIAASLTPEGLAALNAQKNAVSRAHYIRMGAAGLSKRDALLSSPGEVGDLWELHLQAHGVKRREDGG